MHLLHPSKGCCFVRSASCPFSPPLPLFSPLTVMKGELRQLSFSPLLYAARDGERRERRFSRTHPHPFPFLLPLRNIRARRVACSSRSTYLPIYLPTHAFPPSLLHSRFIGVAAAARQQQVCEGGEARRFASSGNRARRRRRRLRGRGGREAMSTTHTHVRYARVGTKKGGGGGTFARGENRREERGGMNAGKKIVPSVEIVHILN